MFLCICSIHFNMKKYVLVLWQLLGQLSYCIRKNFKLIALLHSNKITIYLIYKFVNFET